MARRGQLWGFDRRDNGTSLSKNVVLKPLNTSPWAVRRSISSFSESSMLLYVPRLRNVAPRLQNRFESAFSLHCSGNREESYTGCKNEIREQNPIQRLLHFHSGSFAAAQWTGPRRLSLKESWAVDMLINIHAGEKQSVQSERVWHKRESKRNEHLNDGEL